MLSFRRLHVALCVQICLSTTCSLRSTCLGGSLVASTRCGARPALLTPRTSLHGTTMGAKLVALSLICRKATQFQIHNCWSRCDLHRL
jgi:hypothetical protein